MDLSKTQREILVCLRDAAVASPQNEFTYVTEWLGYLPFGAYHWIEFNGIDLSKILPDGWLHSDIKNLEETGVVVRLSEWQDPNDEFHRKVTYAIV